MVDQSVNSEFQQPFRNLVIFEELGVASLQ